ncbi:MAG: peroxiredoxin [Candidatus Heimdallarchaeota archaeon]|nr:peroxiredoxin [Candidatus Heimdallarchaeota archaeon]RLI72940.1 MAG: peroxiredoxin [Candidatus Gerdarchaeota archaeon]RLI73860.1 MAG: peroxiredoxin [Candidatus Heimdallarchaeota archaeon]
MEETTFPLIGDKAPSFTATTTHGPINFPEDYAGKWVIFFSHPADFTPVCTTEFVAFQKRKAEFSKLNAELLGLSIDQVFSHIKWVEWIKENLDVDIEFPIIADHGQVGKLYGMIHPHKSSSTVRAVFVIDPESIIRAIIYYPPEMGRNMDEILRILEGFQIADKHNVAIPANWPNNELIKDRVIIPPASDVKTAAERKKKYECYDWWLCHKERPK